MKNSVWTSRLASVIWYGGSYLLLCGILFTIWFLFFMTPNVPPLWQQVIGSVVFPFGLLIKMPTESLIVLGLYMVLNVLVWGSLIVMVREYTGHTIET